VHWRIRFVITGHLALGHRLVVKAAAKVGSETRTLKVQPNRLQFFYAHSTG
jgi:hypothetical protein